MAGPLNLSDADLKGFDAVDAGRYNAEVVEITMDATKKDGKVPAGTPLLKFQFRATGDNPEQNGRNIENQRFWAQFVVPPKTHDKTKAQRMKGMIARAFIGLGDSEEYVLSKDFDPDFEDYKGRQCVIVVGKEPKRDGSSGEIIEGEYNNPVKGIKPAGAEVGTGGGLL